MVGRLLKQLIVGRTTQKNLRVLQRLIDYAISTVEACSWVENFWIGALPLGKEPRRLTEAQITALQAARRRSREQVKQARESRLAVTVA